MSADVGFQEIAHIHVNVRQETSRFLPRHTLAFAQCGVCVCVRVRVPLSLSLCWHTPHAATQLAVHGLVHDRCGFAASAAKRCRRLRIIVIFVVFSRLPAHDGSRRRGKHARGPGGRCYAPYVASLPVGLQTDLDHGLFTSHFPTFPLSAGGASSYWEGIWRAGLAPGERWDALQPTPILTQLLETQALPRGRALVPGCGRGYDAIAFGQHGYEAVGLDLSPTAVAEAQKHLASALATGGHSLQGTVSYQSGNFFELDGQFQVIYDYTCVHGRHSYSALCGPHSALIAASVQVSLRHQPGGAHGLGRPDEAAARPGRNLDHHHFPNCRERRSGAAAVRHPTHPCRRRAFVCLWQGVLRLP